MTRKQVADRLGRSLATVRRLEGSLLHPRRDARGVHHFDRHEVEALARELHAGRVSLPYERRATLDGWEPDQFEEAPCHSCEELQQEVDALRRAHEQEVEEIQEESERAKAKHRDEMAELERVVNDFVSTMEALR